METLEGVRIGFAMTGSFCTFSKAFAAAEQLVSLGAELVPILSEHAAGISTRFGTAQEMQERIETIAGRKAILTIEDAEPIGPKHLTDIMAVVPCTSNTAAKLAAGITDSAATMAVKSHLRGGRPVVLAIASNDSLLASAKNIGELFNRKNYYFVPMLQDDIEKKPASLVAEFEMLPQAVSAALRGVQLRPIIYHKTGE
jgi:dipicolinate synthase subunit B